MLFPHQLFSRAGLNSTDVAYLFGVSRITGYRWLAGVNRQGKKGAGVNIFLRDKVADLSKRVEDAIEAGQLPCDELIRMPPNQRAAKLHDILGLGR